MEENHNNVYGKSKEDANGTTAVELNTVEIDEHPSKLNLKSFGNYKSCGRICLRILFIALCVLTSIQSLATIVVTVSSAIASKIYSSEQSGRMVAMIVLATTAGTALAMVIYSAFAVLKNKKKPLHTTATVLVILAIIQAIIVAVAVRVTVEDEMNLGRSLSESFRLAREHNPRHVKIWTTTQYDLECCGVYSAEDYRSPNLPVYFPPDVPISCCPKHDPDRSALVQEREREYCKAKKEFYTGGCKNLVLDAFKETAELVMGMTITLIILEVLLSVYGGYCRGLRQKRIEEGEKDNKNKP